MIDRNETMDIIEIDAASHTGVDNIREEIIDKAGYRPTVLKKKVYIIDEVHMLSKGAFNALLKTMEEPRDYMVFILATTELSKVPETIVSRCQVFNFKKIELWLIVERLRYIAQQESLVTTDDGLAMIAQLSDGCMRDAVKYLDQISSLGEVNAEHVAQFLGVVSEYSMRDLIDLLHQRHDTSDESIFTLLIEKLSQFVTNGVDLTLLPKQIMAYIDQHFAQDQTFFASLTTMVSWLIRDARRYPHPLLLYKTSIWLWKDISWERGKVPKWESFDKVIVAPENIISAKDKEHHTSPQEWSPLKNEKKDIIPQRDDNLMQSDDITSQFIALLPAWSLKTMLTGQCEIESIHDGVVRLIVLNPLAKLPLSKKEAHEPLLAAIRTLTTDPVHALQIVSMMREEYVMR